MQRQKPKLPASLRSLTPDTFEPTPFVGPHARCDIIRYRRRFLWPILRERLYSFVVPWKRRKPCGRRREDSTVPSAVMSCTPSIIGWRSKPACASRILPLRRRTGNGRNRNRFDYRNLRIPSLQRFRLKGNVFLALLAFLPVLLHPRLVAFACRGVASREGDSGNIGIGDGHTFVVFL